MSQLGPWYRGIPQEWCEARLCDNADVINGYPFDSDKFGESSDGFPLVRIRDINSETTEVSYQGDWIPEAEINTGDIVVGMDGDFNVARWRGGKALLNQRVCCILTKHTVDAGFIAYVLPLPLNLINDWTYSTTVKHLSSFDVLKIRLALPPLAAQRRIAQYLDRETARLDELVTAKEQLLKLLDEKRRAFVSRAVTHGLNPRARIKPSDHAWLGDIPAHWEVKRSKRVFTERDDRSETGKEELLTVSHITGVTKRSEKDVNMFEAESNEGYKRCSPGNLVINTLWAWMGAMGVSPEDGIVSPAYHVYELSDEVLPGYVDALVRTPAFTKEVTRFSTGVWSSRLRLYPEGLFEVRIPVPPREEQREIIAAIEKERARTREFESALRRSITLLKERRAALITAAVTGQLAPKEMSA